MNSERFHSVGITETRLNQLRMLADWQLRELGFDPDSIGMACRMMELENNGGKCSDPACQCQKDLLRELYTSMAADEEGTAFDDERGL